MATREPNATEEDAQKYAGADRRAGGRIGVLYSNKDYGCEWDYDYRNKRWLAEDNTKFGVNIVFHALTG